jgi:DNA-binding GntR family transcriptional regulator
MTRSTKKIYIHIKNTGPTKTTYAELANKLGICKATVGRALDVLEQDGLIQRKRGRYITILAVIEVQNTHSSAQNTHSDIQNTHSDIQNTHFESQNTHSEVQNTHLEHSFEPELSVLDSDLKNNSKPTIKEDHDIIDYDIHDNNDNHSTDNHSHDNHSHDNHSVYNRSEYNRLHSKQKTITADVVVQQRLKNNEILNQPAPEKSKSPSIPSDVGVNISEVVASDHAFPPYSRIGYNASAIWYWAMQRYVRYGLDFRFTQSLFRKMAVKYSRSLKGPLGTDWEVHKEHIDWFLDQTSDFIRRETKYGFDYMISGHCLNLRKEQEGNDEFIDNNKQRRTTGKWVK